ncbi:uncharacterized protein LOC135463908 [Liolophura sinensis]|uniref:uncharacterized protein LOC135463908 n=1 Tax=Liolophura sinensis TaxID=3198878 RepID=UPI003158C08D
MEATHYHPGHFINSPPAPAPISFGVTSPPSLFTPMRSPSMFPSLSDASRFRDMLYPNLSIPQSPLLSGIPPPMPTTMTSNANASRLHPPKSEPAHGANFDRLRSNPMFHDLQMLLAHECSQLKVPASLITTSWNMSTLGALGRALPPSLAPAGSPMGYGCSLPPQRSSTQEVYVNHMQLQDDFIRLRLARPEQGHVLLQVENYYSTEVGHLEMSRYKALASSLHHEQTKLALHAYYDKERITLVKKIRTMLTARLGESTVTSPSRSVEGSSQQSLSRVDSTSSVSPSSQKISPGFVFSDRDGPTSEQKPCISSSDSDHEDNISVNSSDFEDEIFRKSDDSEDNSDNARNPASDVSPTDFSTKFGVKCFGTLNDGDMMALPSQSDCTPGSVNQDTQRGRKRLFPEEDVSSSIPIEEKPKKRQRQLSAEATKILTNWYEKNIHYPYPSDTAVEELAQAGGLTVTQVKKWMANKRVRSYNTLSFSGNAHPIKFKFQNKKRSPTSIDQSDKENVNLEKSSENGSGNGICKPLQHKARKVLTDWYNHHLHNPYPTDEEKLQLAMQGGITVSQVKSWFANKRSRTNNTRRQVPNYFIKKYPSYLPYIEMISQRRQSAKRKQEQQASPVFPGHMMY